MDTIFFTYRVTVNCSSAKAYLRVGECIVLHAHSLENCAPIAMWRHQLFQIWRKGRQSNRRVFGRRSECSMILFENCVIHLIEDDGEPRHADQATTNRRSG